MMYMSYILITDYIFDKLDVII